MSLTSHRLPRTAHRPLTHALPSFTPGTQDGDRYHALDALRAAAMLLGIVLHASISYLPRQMPHLLWAIHDRAEAAWLEWLFWGIHAFRLPVFFLLAGFFAAMLHQRRGGREYLVNRTRRIFVPFAVACALLLPVIFLIWCCGWLLSGQCTPGQVLRMKFDARIQAGVYGLAHLWFLEHLYLLSVGYWAWQRLHGRGYRLARWWDRTVVWQDRLIGWRHKAFLLAVPTAVVVWTSPAAVIDFDQTIVPHFGRLAYNATFFIAGVWLYRQRDRLEQLTAGYAVHLLLAVPVFVALALLLPMATTTALPLSGQLAFAWSSALTAWLVAFGLLGLFVRLFRRSVGAVRYLSDASYFVYLVHLPLVGMVQVGLYGFDWPAEAKFLLALVVSTAISLAVYHDVARYSWIGKLLNGRRMPRPAHSPRAWLYAAVPIVLCAVVLSAAWRLRTFLLHDNFHPVLAGEVYRSARPDSEVLERWIDELGIRTVVGLQGGDDSLAWFTAQKRLCFSRGVGLYILDSHEDGLPTRDQLTSLIAVLDHTPRPILLYGRFGMNRTGLAAAVARLLAGDDPQSACNEYRLEHGSFDRTSGSTQRVIADYDAWLTENGLTHTPARFRHWAGNVYQPFYVDLPRRD